MGHTHSIIITDAVVPELKDWGPSDSSSFQNLSSSRRSPLQLYSAHLRAMNLPPCPSKTPNIVWFLEHCILKKSSSFIEYISTP